jgi:cytochrome c
MKKIFASLAIVTILFGCGNNSDDKKQGDKKEDVKKETVTDITQDPDYQKGLALVANSDCLTCHKVDEVITGPTYRDVANKYAGMPDTIVAHLARNVINGSRGVWGDAYMTPHAGLSQQDAEQMVKYILLLKNK